MPENSFEQSAEFFLERSRRIASKVTALSRKEDPSANDVKELAEIVPIADLYAKIGLGYALLYAANRDEKET